MVLYVTFLCDVACQKLLNSANVSRSYSQNNTGTVFLRHGVVIVVIIIIIIIVVPPLFNLLYHHKWPLYCSLPETASTTLSLGVAGMEAQNLFFTPPPKKKLTDIILTAIILICVVR